MIQHRQKTAASQERHLVEVKGPLREHANVREHLANERTFLAWIRTALAAITFACMMGRFAKPHTHKGTALFAIAQTSLLGICGVALGVVMMGIALLNFLAVRRALEEGTFRAQKGFSVALTLVTTLMGVLLLVFLLLNQE